MLRPLFFSAIISAICTFAHADSETASAIPSDLLAKILAEQPDSIENVQDGKFYLKAERIFPTAQGFFLSDNHSAILLPMVFSDNHGCYIANMGEVSGFSWIYTCANCKVIWDPNYSGTQCPVCGKPGQAIPN